MYIKKSVLIICTVLVVLSTIMGTVMFVNPFGALNFAGLLKFNAGIAVLDHYYYEEVDKEALVDGALLGVSQSVNDPYTVYMNREEATGFLEDVESDDYTGVGLYISSSEVGDGVTVVSPLADSPAEKAGIVSGDKILMVDGESVAGKNIEQVATDMKGPEGTEVTLTLLKKSTNETVEVKLTRATIKRETVSSQMLENNVGYIQITQFGVNTDDEFVEHFNKLVAEKMDYVVLDLRNNPGGYMEIAVNIADLFIDEGKIVYTQNKKGEVREYMANEGRTKAPMAVLSNGGTASASEILIGAFRDHGLATIVGEKTFGKGVTQIPYSFWDGSIMKMTDSRYYTPSGVCIDHEGIEPDVEVVMTDEEYASITEVDSSQDKQLKKAIEILLEE